MEASGQFHAPAALTPVPIKQEAGWDPQVVQTMWRKEINVLPLPGIELTTCLRYRRSYTRQTGLHPKCWYLGIYQSTRCHITQHSLHSDFERTSSPVLQDILAFLKIFSLSKSIQSSTECLMFTSVVHFMERLPPSDSASQNQIKSQSKAAFLLSSTKYIFK